MKVFWQAKFTEDDPLPLYRSLKEADNMYSIKIGDNLPFNYIVIKNPDTSNLIYILHNLYLKPNECAGLKLFMSDNISIDYMKAKDKNLQIKAQYDNINVSNMIELSTLNCTSNLLTNHYIILIPGGSIIIRANTPILKTELCMDYTIQEL